MSYSNGLLPSSKTNINNVQLGKDGRDGIGFKLTSNGNYDMDQKIMRNMKVPDDVPEVGDYNSYVKDQKTGVNKEYVNEHFLKKGSDDNYDLKAGSIIKNSEPYYDGLYDDNTLVSKKYVDLQDAKQDIAINSNSQLIGNKADLTKRTVQTFAGRIQVPNFDGNNHHLADATNLRYVIGNYLNKNTGGILNKSIQFNSSNSNDDRQLFGLGTPKYNSSAVNKQYVDNAVASSGGGVDDSKYLYLDGSRQMTGDLDLDYSKVINSDDPTDAGDLVTKNYMDSHFSNSHVTSSNKSNSFKYVMDDP